MSAAVPHSSEPSNDNSIHVLVVDDHELFRAGLADLLAREGLTIVGTAADGETALELVTQVAPDVVLMDLDLPGLSGVETTRQIAEIAPTTRVLVLTISVDEQNVVDAIAAGACGYLLKGSLLESLVAGIKAACRGDSVLSAPIAAKLFESIRTADRKAADEGPVSSELSERELEILKLIASGMRNIEIAKELVISPHTVRNHVSNILAKLHIHNRIEAATYAIRHRMI